MLLFLFFLILVDLVIKLIVTYQFLPSLFLHTVLCLDLVHPFFFFFLARILFGWASQVSFTPAQISLEKLRPVLLS